MTVTLGPEVVKIDGNAAPEEPLELDESRLVPGSPVPAQFVRNAFTDVTGRFFGGITLIISTFLTQLLVLPPWYILLPAGISVMGFSVLSGVGMIYVTKGFYLAVKWYVLLHAKIFSGR